jgi:hypothetical protein
MPRYRRPLDPETAAAVYGGVPGNYILFDRWNRAYAGKQGPGVNRLAAHLRNHPGEFVAAQFMVDHGDDDRVRSAREGATTASLIDDGVRVRNKRWPAKPRTPWWQVW